MNGSDRYELGVLEDRIYILLPELYRDSYEEVQPISMGSASLKFDNDGKVAWDQVWTTFCDLAMAGGPPHKGTLLEPASPAEIEAAPDQYATVTAEICRGIGLAANLSAEPSPVPGWIWMRKLGQAMAHWLLRAIVMENVSVRCADHALWLPAGPAYRLEKEIKNVVTVIAKTSHYWSFHMSSLEHRAVANLLTELDGETPLVSPALANDSDADVLRRARANLAASVQQRTGLQPTPHAYTNWLGVECPSVRLAIWMMRGLVVSNVLARREGTALLVPVNPAIDPTGHVVATALARIQALAAAKGVV